MTVVEGIVGRQANSADHEDSKGNGGQYLPIESSVRAGKDWIKEINMTNETSLCLPPMSSAVKKLTPAMD